MKIVLSQSTVKVSLVLVLVLALALVLVWPLTAFADSSSTARQARAKRLPDAAWGLASTEAKDAWRVEKALRARASGQRAPTSITVAIIDTGADVRHPQLSGRVWMNPGETGSDERGRDRAHNGIDDDQNGYIDDVNGWNFPGRSSDVADHHGHGTHIAGIVASVAPSARLMILKYYDPATADINAIPNTVRAIDYAVSQGAQIINYSAGGPRANIAEKAAIERARRQGVLVVAAAGNEAANSDIFRYYPADYGLPNILSVTAIDPDNKILPTSNWGLQTVHLAAPGEAIFSALPGGKYGRMTGTSQATAYASGVAALLLSHSAVRESPERVIEHLVNSGLQSEGLRGRTRARSVLNAFRALAIQGSGTAACGFWSPNTAAIDPALFSPDVSLPEIRRAAPLLTNGI